MQESNSRSRNYLLYRSTGVYTLFLLGVHVAQILDFCVVFCRSLFVLLSLFFWPLCCRFFEVRFLITSFISSNLLQEDTSIYEHHSVSKSSYDMARHVYIVIFNHVVSLLYYLEILCLAIVRLVSDIRK